MYCCVSFGQGSVRTSPQALQRNENGAIKRTIIGLGAARFNRVIFDGSVQHQPAPATLQAHRSPADSTCGVSARRSRMQTHLLSTLRSDMLG